MVPVLDIQQNQFRYGPILGRSPSGHNQKRLGDNWQPFYDYIGFGMYHDQIKAYQDEFGKDKVNIFLFDDLKKDAGKICKEIFLFLGVDPDYAPDTNQIYNPSGKPKSEFLKDFLISPNFLKSALKKIIPRPKRQQLKHMAAGKLLNKVEMPRPHGRYSSDNLSPRYTDYQIYWTGTLDTGWFNLPI